MKKFIEVVGTVVKWAGLIVLALLSPFQAFMLMTVLDDEGSES